MDKIKHNELVCPDHGIILTLRSDEVSYLCEQGCRFEIIDDIPRFVAVENYASSFGLQWKKFRQSQLDSYSGLSISCDRLTRIAGGSLELFKDQYVLEAGCGAGRFTELLLDTGARVFSVDISTAVEANFQNFVGRKNYTICQADILRIPVNPNTFDIVLCIGVVQHTPDPEETIRKLCSYLRPGGLLLMDHYSKEYPLTLSRRVLRSLLKSASAEHAFRFVSQLVRFLWPLHQILNRYFRTKILRPFRSLWIRLSPVVDYSDSYSQLSDEILFEWAVLDTHDTLTDHYKHLRSAEEIRAHLAKCGMVQIEIEYAGNGVEARARRPLQEMLESA